MGRSFFRVLVNAKMLFYIRNSFICHIGGAGRKTRTNKPNIIAKFSKGFFLKFAAVFIVFVYFRQSFLFDSNYGITQMELVFVA